VSEATGADIEHLGLERGHRTLVITRKGGKVVTIPLAPRTARTIDLVTGERIDGPLFVTADGRRLDRHGAARIVRRVTRRAGIAKQVSPHTLRHAFITAALDAGVPLRDVQEAASHADPRTTMRYDRDGDVLRLMEDHHIRRLPVIEEQQIIGMISEADLATHLPEAKVAEFAGRIYSAPPSL
jgi:integrase